MKMNWQIIKAIALRDLRTYFSSPTGYVFLTLFIFLSAASAFWQERFFALNLANLNLLNEVFPFLLLFFVPAITMNVWSSERKAGTDELLLTLPATDAEIVLGKYFSVLGVYTAALVFSVSNVLVLFWLGSPDIGLLLANYIGYWLIGASLLAVGMLASMLTTNATVAFILGALISGFFVLVGSREWVVSRWAQDILSPLSVVPQFNIFGKGILSLPGLVFFLSLTGLMLFFNVALLGRRHWPTEAASRSYWMHQAVRAVALIVALGAVNAIITRTGGRIDFTAEGLHSLSDETRQLIRDIDPEHPVLVQAFVSSEVPREYVGTRENIVNTLEEISAVGGDRVQVLIHETEPYSEEARDARDKFGIVPRELVSTESARISTSQVFLGIAATSGAAEQVIPFFDRGLPVEYEIIRTIRVAAKLDRKVIGILNTSAEVFGSFNYQTYQSTPPWSIAQELRKQYEVRNVSADQPYPDDLDGLLVVLPSSLTQPQMDRLQDYITAGNPTLLMVDPLPMVKPMLAPIIPAGAQANPFARQQNETPPKGDVLALMDALGLKWVPSMIVWDSKNPHPSLSGIPEEYVFVAPSEDDPEAFNTKDSATSGLQEVVAIYPGYIFKSPSRDYTFEPLMRTGRLSGATPFNQIVQQGFLGLQVNPKPRRSATTESYILAGKMTGSSQAMPEQQMGGAQPGIEQVNAVVIADVDIISDQFFAIRAQGSTAFNFDNVTFVLNCMDGLVEDDSFMALRKKRNKHRTLERVEEQTKEFVEQRMKDEQKAEADAQAALGEAQSQLDTKVAELQRRTDLDDRARNIMVRNLQEVETRKFNVAKVNIEAHKEATVAASREKMETAVRGIQSRIKTLAVLIPPIPVFLLGVWTFFRRRKREIESTAEVRRLRS